MPMSATCTRPACERPGSNNSPGLSAAKQIVVVRVHRFAACCAGCAVDTGGDVDRERRERAIRERARGERAVAVEGTAEPGAEHCVDCKVGALQRARKGHPVDAVGEREHVDAGTECAQQTRRDAPVGAVVPLSRDHDRSPSVDAPEHPARPFGDSASRALDEDGLGRSRRDRAPVGGGHLGRRDDCFHDRQWPASVTTGSVSRSTRSIVPSTSSRMTGSVSVT